MRAGSFFQIAVSFFQFAVRLFQIASLPKVFSELTLMRNMGTYHDIHELKWVLGQVGSRASIFRSYFRESFGFEGYPVLPDTTRYRENP